MPKCLQSNEWQAKKSDLTSQIIEQTVYSVNQVCFGDYFKSEITFGVKNLDQ